MLDLDHPETHISTAEGDFAWLTDRPLDPARIEASVRSEKDGAVVTFVGYTRDNFQGRTVTHLTYESYVPLALKTLRQVLADVRALPPPPPLAGVETHHCAAHAPCSHFSASSASSADPGPPRIALSRIRIAHLLGPSPPLTPSIVITVSSPHRREAFYACEWLLEEVKRRVQVWKREWYAPLSSGGEEDEGKGGEGDVFVGRDGEGPLGRGGRAGENKWKENFPPAPKGTAGEAAPAGTSAVEGK
ncbi:hypothetical protein JCM10207_006300 [Rhodosporidiobolus poonsookiae]